MGPHGRVEEGGVICFFIYELSIMYSLKMGISKITVEDGRECNIVEETTVFEKIFQYTLDL